ncbi:MAG: hypothetical protein M0Z31_01945 [Clostridia bacterium]|nr:hypothetical protein [Clostridia bacterium]
MRKPMLVLAIFIIALAAATIGPTMFQSEESPKNPQEPPVVVNQKQPSLDVPKEPVQEPATVVPVTPVKEKASKPELPMVQPEVGEIIVEGKVTGIDTKNRVISFAQEMDDNSVQVAPDVEVLKDAIVIKSSLGKVSLEALQKGSYVTMVLDKNHRAKSVEISN